MIDCRCFECIHNNDTECDMVPTIGILSSEDGSHIPFCRDYKDSNGEDDGENE